MPYTTKRKRVHTVKWDRCVKKVRKKRTSANPYAVCTSQLGKESFLRKKKPKKYRETFGGVDYEEWHV